MKRIPEQIVQEIYEAIDIVEIIEEFLPLQKKGTNYWALSPFKSERTPSFSVSPSKGIYKCFATQNGGNAVKFLMEVESMSYPEALTHIAKKYGIDIEPSYDEEQIKAADNRRQLKNKVAKAVQYYIDNRGDEFKEFLEERNISPEAAEKFELGFAPEGDPFAKINRIIFPIWDNFGEPIAFGGRKLIGDGPKYKNSSESLIYNKSKVVYAWHIARGEVMRKDLAILTEGYIDAIALHDREITNVIATCGTALTPDHVKIIKRATKNVLILRDGDDAGRKASIEDIEVLLKQGMNPTVLMLPQGLDPDDYINQFGAKSFLNFQNTQAVSWLKFLVKIHSKKEMNSTDRTKMIRAVCDKLKCIDDHFSLREHIKEAGKLLDTPEDLIYHEIGIAPPVRELITVDQEPIKDFKRTFNDYLELYKELGIRKCPDFEKSDQGFVRIAYKDIKGNDHKITKNKVSKLAIRVTNSTDKPTGVYIPPALRAGGNLHPPSKIKGLKESDPDSAKHRKKILSLPLVLVMDEIAADIFCELGLPTVGLPRKDGFSTKLGSDQLHAMLASILNLGFRNVIYLLPGEAFRLPYAKRIPGEYPYAEVDAGKNAEAYSNIMIRLNKCLRNFKLKTHILHPGLSEDGPQVSHDLWVSDWILSLQSPTLLPHIFRDLDDTKNHFNIVHHEIFYYSEEQMLEVMMANNPQRFYEYHGFDSLSGVFKFRKTIYEADPNSGKVAPKEKDGPSPDVWFNKKTGFIMARDRTGQKCIGEFNITCEVMIKGVKPLNLYTITNDSQTVTRQLIMSPSDFRKPDAFCDLIGNLPGMKCFFTGSKQNLLDLQKLVHDNSLEATTLEGHLGFLELEDGDWCYIMGNGIIDSSGNFHEVDERGLIDFKNTTYFLPAESSILSSSKVDYNLEQGFSYRSSEISYRKYIDLYHSVFQDAAHATFSYIVSSLFYDHIFKINSCYPHLFLEGIPGSGKTKCILSALALFGETEGVNLDSTKVSPPAFSALFSQYHNGINHINEFNIQTIQKWMTLALKSPYDGQLGARMQKDWTTNRIDYGAVESATILAGQNPIYMQEALNERCNIYFIEKRDDFTDDEKDLYNYLVKKVRLQGLGHILAQLLAYRDLIKQYFIPYQTEIQRWLEKNTKLNSGKSDRLIENHAMTIAPLLILIEKGKLYYPFDREQILEFEKKQIEAHDEQMMNKGVLDLLFNDFIEGYYMDPKYGLTDNHVFFDRDKGVLNIQVKGIYPRFKDFLNRNYPDLENTSKAEITRKLKSHQAAIKKNGEKVAKAYDKAWVGYKRDEHRQIKMKKVGVLNGVPKYEAEKRFTSALQFDPTKLKIDLTNVTFSFDNYDQGAKDVEDDE